MATNLITGGMGFLGTYLARQLLVDGEEVVLFDRKEQLSHTAAYEDFGYKPRYLLDEMVKDFINSVR